MAIAKRSYESTPTLWRALTVLVCVGIAIHSFSVLPRWFASEPPRYPDEYGGRVRFGVIELGIVAAALIGQTRFGRTRRGRLAAGALFCAAVVVLAIDFRLSP